MVNSFNDKELTVSSDGAGERLDIFLSKRLVGFSRSKIQHLIETGLIILNGKNVKKNARCFPGDTIVVHEGAREVVSRDIFPQNIPVDIIYEDDYLIAVNKRAGMVAHPGSGNRNATLVNALLFHADHLSRGFENDRPGIVHRLDKDTSGVMLVAKTDAMHAALASMFSTRTIKKYYIGICFGVRPAVHGSIDMPLGRNRRVPIKRSVQIEGKNAVTEFWLLLHEHGVSVMRFRPHTGRTHQIRVHCSSSGFPIIGDQLYGGGKEQMEKISVLERPFAYKVFKCFNRQALHARAIVFSHPLLKKSMRIVAPFPVDFEDAFRLLGCGPSIVDDHTD